MKSWLIVFGHAALHSYWFVQLPKPSRSIAAIIFSNNFDREPYNIKFPSCEFCGEAHVLPSTANSERLLVCRNSHSCLVILLIKFYRLHLRGRK